MCRWTGIMGALCAAGVFALGACATPRINTTMLDARDIVSMTDAMLESLARDPAIGQRPDSSAPWIVTLDRAENMTEHPMSENERWTAMARLRAKLAESSFAHEHALIFILPGEEWRRLEPAQAAASTRLQPTHALRATFWSDTQSNRRQRTDAYLCTFRLSELTTGAILWEDAFELEHAIARNTLD
ncbi:MAG: hypothetical protein KDA20_02475 [Phycisphaerales bacterium]|nr:hypothetical protein [Phycisphaerales bacterium]